MKKNNPFAPLQNSASGPTTNDVTASGLIPKNASALSKSGIALVIVLGMLVLVAVLVIAFLSSISTELQSSKSYASGADVRTLADSAVNIVISQIQDATASGTLGASGTYTLAWASQPGMVRTYDNTGATVSNYKLYSSGQLRVSGSYNPVSNLSSEIPDTWASGTNADLYTDLNKPVTVMSGTTPVTHYPIIDPSAVAALQTGTVGISGTYNSIEGCYLNTTTNITGTSASQTNPIPLPVQWMYVLKDGSVVSIDPVTKKISGVGNTLADGTLNTVVGRIAFWTDDESCKVNVNTASEGTFWDRPWADSTTKTGTIPTTLGYETSLASSMPVQNEFQRYPGHPAMTCLSPIFPPLAGETKVQYGERIFKIIPRLSGGGSQSASAYVSGTTVPLIPGTQRLFSSVDEFLFSGTTMVSGTRQANPKDSAGPPADLFTQVDLERTRFFLTANSRAPEVNLFNKPRVTLWPLQINPDPVSGLPTRNPMDQLIAFCSTIGGTGANSTPYYFQRYNTYNSANASTPLSSQSPVMDWNLIPRNRKLFAYLQSLTSNPIPGFGGSLSGNSGKYSPAVGDQILTEMMDYIRSEVNTFSTITPTPYYYTPFNTSGFVTGEGQIAPLVLSPTTATGWTAPYTTKGFGRFQTIIQAALVFYRTDSLSITSGAVTKKLPDDALYQIPIYTGTAVPNPSWNLTMSGTSFTYSDYTSNAQVGAVLILQPFHTTPGSPSWTPNVTFVVNGLDQFTANGATMGFPAAPANVVTGIDANANQTALSSLELYLKHLPNANGFASSSGTLVAGYPSPKTLGPSTFGSPNPLYYPFYGNFTLTGSGNTFLFNSGSGSPGVNISIDIYPGPLTEGSTLNPQDKIQTVNMTFPGATLPVPTYFRTPSAVSASGNTITSGTSQISGTFTVFYDNEIDGAQTVSNTYCYNNYNKRLSHQHNFGVAGGWGIDEDNAGNLLPLFRGNGVFGDTVRSVEARYVGSALGDYRLFAGLANVPASYFEGHGLNPTTDPTRDGLLYTTSTLQVLHSIRIDWPSVNDNANDDGFYYGAGIGSGTGVGSSYPRGLLLPSTVVTYLDPGIGSQARNSKFPAAPLGLRGAYMYPGNTTILGDWDTGQGSQIDGAFINKSDEANSNGGGTLYYTNGRYLGTGGIVESGASYSPNRQIASAVAFGSLPVGIDPTSGTTAPWRTLLFCANPLAGPGHPGFGTPASVNNGPPYTAPPDHLFLDFFTMPTVEPYAISDPFSTAGKVNMNYQIVPFTYLTRDTAVRAVLKSTCVMAIPTNQGSTYKWGAMAGSGTLPPASMRYSINPDEINGTLAGFEQRWTAGDIFRSASQICDIYLVPQYVMSATGVTTTPAPAIPTPAYGTAPSGSTYGSSIMPVWWYGPDYGITPSSTRGYKLTGDNVREVPYGQIYPRLTTKSNTFTVHVQTQSLKKAPNTPANQFISGQDQVTGEFRGSFIIQRYLDPNSDTLVQVDGKTPASETDSNAMVGPYKFRIISTKRFAP